MLKLFRLCSALAMLSVGSLLATDHPCPGNWGASIDFLYLKPSVDDTFFVVKASEAQEVPSGQKHNNEFGFKPGFRIGGVYALCDCNQELQVYYTRLSANHRKSVSGNFLWRPGSTAAATVGFAGGAESNLHTLYQRVDANFAQQTYSCCGLDVYLQLGLEFASFHLKERHNYTLTGNGSFSNHQQSKSCGLGPQLGMALEYELCDCSEYLPGSWSITGLASGSLLASQNKLRNQQTGLNLRDQNTWRLVPALHARIGLNYATTIDCYEANLEVGYEFNSYLRGLTRNGFPNSLANLNPVGHYNYDLQGLYVSASVQF